MTSDPCGLLLQPLNPSALNDPPSQIFASPLTAPSGISKEPLSVPATPVKGGPEMSYVKVSSNGPVGGVVVASTSNEKTSEGAYVLPLGVTRTEVGAIGVPPKDPATIEKLEMVSKPILQPPPLTYRSNVCTEHDAADPI